MVKEQAAWALRNLAVNNANKVSIARAGAIPLLVALLKDPDHILKESAARVLLSLAVNIANRLAIGGEKNAITKKIEMRVI